MRYSDCLLVLDSFRCTHLTSRLLPQNMVHIAESTVGRRYAGWFIRNTEHAQRVLDTLRNASLPIASGKGPAPAQTQTKDAPANINSANNVSRGGQRVAWGSVKVA